MQTLSAKKLGKRFKRKIVVKDVSLEVKQGNIVGLLGPNGAGKTTCFYMMVGLLPCDQGQIMLSDEDLTHLPMHVRARKGVSYLPQEPSIFRKLSVANNILAILELQPHLSRKQQQHNTDAILKEFNIEHIRDHTGSSLSGGERRRVEIARAVASDPTFILLDEPFAGVDPISVVDLKRIIRHLAARNIGILITDHNVRETLDICQQATIVSNGEVIAQGSPATILDNQQVREIYLGDQFQL